MDHDLLHTPLLSYRDPRRRRGRATLPGLLAGLAAGEVGDFPRLRTHQLDPWCMFLTQLAAIALHRAGQSDPRLPEDEWRRLLLALTDGRHEPWCLMVEDLAQPAFFQPPVPEGTIEKWSEHECPDDVDLLVTAKAHDVKTGLIPGDDLEAWVYALTTLQTMQGYPGGAGRYHGIARMNGGYGSRARVGLAPDPSLAARFRRDLDVLTSSWSALIERGYRDDGLALVWTAAWDGRTSLAMNALAPHFIEICARLRCVHRAGGGLACRYTTTGARRCLQNIDNGDVGDAWAPIERDKGALSIGRRGFHYDLLRRLLFEGDFEPAATQRLRADDPDPVLFLASALARGQGKTEGLHERALVLTSSVRVRLFRPDARAELAARAAARVQRAQLMQSKVLYPALRQLGVAASDFDARVDDAFFDHLFATLDAPTDDARLAWDSRLRDIARGELETAVRRCAVPCARRFKAVSDAEGLFGACLRKHFADLVEAERTDQGAPR